MKKIICLLVAGLVLACNVGEAVDALSLDGKGEEYIMSVLGKPEERVRSEYDGWWIKLYYPEKLISISEDDASLSFAVIWDGSMCVLSDYIEGGVKVGDDADKVLSFDFAATRYGRGKAANNCVALPQPVATENCPYTFNYVVFNEEYSFIMFAIADSKIQAIAIDSKEDAPYADYDFDNRL